MISGGDGNDPRLERDPSDAPDALGPTVGAPATANNTVLIAGAFVVVAVGLFLLLNAQRLNRLNGPSATSGTEVATASAPPPPLELPAPAPAPQNADLLAGMAPAPLLVKAPPPPAAPLLPPQIGVMDGLQRLRAPAVVVDLQSATGPGLVQASQGPTGSEKGGATQPALNAATSGKDVAQVGPAAALASTASPLATAGRTPGGDALDQFAARASNAEPTVAVASQMASLSTVITQGAMIPAILETALNSDLPGYARAVVSRDVRSFDGKVVLLPRGSHLIGQYRSAMALGQSRVFVIWTRVIRPDGVSVMIGSPGADALGRGGLEGQVDRHFFTRFGGSILLSVLNAGIAAVSRTPATTITIGSPAAAVAAAGSASNAPGDVPPTIKIGQGEAINIFVARDLDFSEVQPVR